MTTSQTTLSEFRKAEEDNFNRALRLRDEGRLEDAIRIMRGIADRFPDIGVTFMMLGGMYKQLSRHDEELHAFRRAVELMPRRELANRGLFHALWNLRKEVEAISVIKQYTELTESDAFKDILERYRAARESGPD